MARQREAERRRRRRRRQAEQVLGRRHLRPLLLIAVLACDRAVILELPEAPEQELAVALLYDGDAEDGGSLIEIGPVARRQVLYSGRYAIEAMQAGLTARIVFAAEADVLEAGRAACAGLSTAVERKACERWIGACEGDATECLSIAREAEGCGDRVALDPALRLAAFEAEPGGDFEPVDGTSAAETLDGALACGPVVRPGCPLQLPGFTLTEAGRFACIAPSDQIGCELAIDLSRCGFGEVRGTLDAAGVLTQRDGSCRAEPLPGAGGHALVCGERTLVASPMQTLFGEPGCRRTASPVYDADFSEPGVITGFLAFEAPGWPRRHLATGFGFDDCASSGCAHRSDSCDLCTDSCDQDFELNACARSEWPSCTMLDAREQCLARCQSWCNRASASCADTAGLALTVHSPELPELERTRIDLDSGGDAPASSSQALLVLGPDRVAVASRHRVQLFRAGGTDQLELLDELAVDFEIAGLVAPPNAVDELYAFGASDLGTAQLARLGAGAGAMLEVLEVAEVPDRSDFTAAAATDRWVVLAAPEGLHAIALDGGALPSISVEGRPTAVAALASGSILIAVKNAGASQLALLVPDGAGLRTHRFEVTPGLSVASLASGDGDRAFVGVETEDAGARGLVGVFQLDAVNPESSALLPTFVETAESEVSLLYLDQRVLYAVARHRNVITPIALVD